MTYQIIFTDIDGTLLRSDKTVSRELLTSIRKYTAAGGRLVLSSGRALPSVLKVAQQLALPTENMFCIAYNGAVVYDLGKRETLLQQPIPLPVVRTILDLAHERGIHCHTYTDDTILSEFNTPELHKYADHVRMPFTVTEDAVSYLESLGGYMPFKLLALTLDDRKPLIDLGEIISSAVGAHIHTFFSSSCYLECCRKEASKGNAVSFLCRHLGVSKADTAAAGDAPNDISMLKAVGTSYAMRGAPEEVIMAADHTTERTNDEDGILELLRLV